jgi:hypothetical protein
MEQTAPLLRCMQVAAYTLYTAVLGVYAFWGPKAGAAVYGMEVGWHADVAVLASCCPPLPPYPHPTTTIIPPPHLHPTACALVATACSTCRC